MVIFDEILKEIKSKSEILIKNSLAEYITEANSDVRRFLDLSKAKLNRYAVQYKNGKITKEELEWLIESQKDLLELKDLEQIGLAKLRVYLFKKKFLNIIIKAVTGNIL